MVDGQLGNEIDGCGDDVEQFVCAQVNSILQMKYLKKKKKSEKNLHLLYSVEALQTNDALDATSPSIAAGIIVRFTFFFLGFSHSLSSLLYLSFHSFSLSVLSITYTRCKYH